MCCLAGLLGYVLLKAIRSIKAVAAVIARVESRGTER